MNNPTKPEHLALPLSMEDHEYYFSILDANKIEVADDGSAGAEYVEILSRENAAYFMHCVNNHDALTKERDELKAKNEELAKALEKSLLILRAYAGDNQKWYPYTSKSEQDPNGVHALIDEITLHHVPHAKPLKILLNN